MPRLWVRQESLGMEERDVEARNLSVEPRSVPKLIWTHFGYYRAMIPTTWKFILIALAGWINRKQEDIIEYLREENRVLREQFGPGRVRFTDSQRRRLGVGSGQGGWREVARVNPPMGGAVCPLMCGAA